MSDRKPTLYASAEWHVALNRDDMSLYISDQKNLTGLHGNPGYLIVPLTVLEAIVSRAGEYE